MKSLKTCRGVLTWLYLCPSDKLNESMGEKEMHIIFGSSIFLANFLNVIVSAAFFVKYISTDLEECLYSLFEIVGFLGMVYVILIAFSLRNKIFAIFESLDTIYDKCKMKC